LLEIEQGAHAPPFCQLALSVTPGKMGEVFVVVGTQGDRRAHPPLAPIVVAERPDLLGYQSWSRSAVCAARPVRVNVLGYARGVRRAAVARGLGRVRALDGRMSKHVPRIGSRRAAHRVAFRARASCCAARDLMPTLVSVIGGAWSTGFAASRVRARQITYLQALLGFQRGRGRRADHLPGQAGVTELLIGKLVRPR
jgi:hypothetical protein